MVQCRVDGRPRFYGDGAHDIDGMIHGTGRDDACNSNGRTALGIVLAPRHQACWWTSGTRPRLRGYDWENKQKTAFGLQPGGRVEGPQDATTRCGKSPGQVRRKSHEGERHRHQRDDARLPGLRCGWEPARAVSHLAQHHHRPRRGGADEPSGLQHSDPLVDRAPVPGDFERRGARGRDRLPHDAGGLRALEADRAEGDGRGRLPAACSPSTAPPSITTRACWTSSRRSSRPRNLPGTSGASCPKCSARRGRGFPDEGPQRLLANPARS